jgi:hypothetical protein
MQMHRFIEVKTTIATLIEDTLVSAKQSKHGKQSCQTKAKLWLCA